MNWGTFGDPDVFYALGANGRRYRVKKNKHGGSYWYADEWSPDMLQSFDLFRRADTKEECMAWCEQKAQQQS